MNDALHPHVDAYWREYLAHAARAPDTPLYDVFHFDDNEADANELAELVLHGKKAATASLFWEYETENGRPPRAGDLSVVVDWGGAPVCVVETTGVAIRAFGDVDAEFAAAEGEGDRSLEHWRRVHWAYFGRVCERLERERTRQMPVVCERFRVVFPPPDG